MLETLMPFLLGEKDPKQLLEMAQQQLDTGRAALMNDSDLEAKARTLFEKRQAIYPDASDPDEIMKVYDFTNAYHRIAFAIACLPEELRCTVMHEIYKGMCVWSGYAQKWTETTPGDLLRNGRERLLCPDSAIGVLEEAEKLLADRPDLVDDYLAALKESVEASYADAHKQLEEMQQGFRKCDVDDLVGRLRAAVGAALGEDDEDDEEEDDEEAVSLDVSQEASHPKATQDCILCDTFKHPLMALAGMPVTVNDWVTRLPKNDDCARDYAIRERFYSLPADQQIVEVCVADGEYMGTKLHVHASELV